MTTRHTPFRHPLATLVLVAGCGGAESPADAGDGLSLLNTPSAARS
jgi:hypothetical protein